MGLGLNLGQVQWYRLWVGLGLRLLLHLDLLWLVVRMVLELWGSCSVLAETTGLSCTVDLTQSVQCLTLSVLQQVCLALEDSDVPGVALHGLLKFAAFQTLLCSNAMQVLMEVQTCPLCLCELGVDDIS